MCITDRNVCTANWTFSCSMATLIWKARKEMNTLGFIFEKKLSIKDTRSKFNGKLCQPVPGHPELTSNKMAQIWNNLNLSNSKSIAVLSAIKWYQDNPKISNRLIMDVILLIFYYLSSLMLLLKGL